MKRIAGILKKIFFLPPLPTFFAAAFGYVFIILVSALQISIPMIQYASYFCSAYALVVTITGFPHFIKSVKSVRRRLMESPLMKKLRSTPVGGRYFSDVRFRTEVSLYQSLFINLLYIVMKLISGIYYRSFWFISLAVYYFLLAAMRFLLLRQGKRQSTRSPMENEFYRYRLCGIILLVMNQALSVIVILMVYQNRSFDYPGLLIYAMAMYSFYSVITAAVNLVKFRKHGSPVMSAAKVINLVAAMVSILSLETAMLAQFGGDDETFRTVMTGVTGSCVCIIVIGMAVFMIWKSSRQLKKLQINNS